MRLDSGFHGLNSGFQGLDSRFQSQGFRIPKAKKFWIPDSGFPYMGRTVVNLTILSFNAGKITGPKRSIKITDHSARTSANVICFQSCTNWVIHAKRSERYTLVGGNKVDCSRRSDSGTRAKEQKNRSHSTIWTPGTTRRSLPRTPARRRKKWPWDATKPVAWHFKLQDRSSQHMTICGLSLHQGGVEGR